MNLIQLRVRQVFAIAGLLAVLGLSTKGLADPGDFWYGLYNVHETGDWQSTVWDSMNIRFKMNYAYVSDGISEERYNAGMLGRADNNGINIMQGAAREPGDSAEQAVILWKYSNSAYLRVESDPDTVMGYWEPVIEYPIQECPRVPGIYTRYSECNDALEECSSGAACCGGIESDAQANNGYSYHFAPYADGSPDSIFVVFWGGIRKENNRAPTFQFRLRTTATGCSDTLARIVVRRNIKPHCWYADSFWVDLASQTLTCGDFPDSNYREFFLEVAQGENEYLHAFVLWTGQADLWVDWIEVFDQQGGNLVNDSATTNDELRSYIDTYTFDHHQRIIGFYMTEEWTTIDPNIIPQARVAQVVRASSVQACTLTTFTEHPGVRWWPQHQIYGGHMAASARIDPVTPVSGIAYIYTGYHFERKNVPRLPIEPAVIDTILELDGTGDCIGSDTSVCLQERMASLADLLATYKDLARRTSHRFVPHLQAYSEQLRLEPDSCHEDPETEWMVGRREQTENEAKLLASMALAHGANGLIYFVTGAITDLYKDITVHCRDSTDSVIVGWHWKRERKGLTRLPGVQAALENYVGPLVDSLGYLFADKDAWRWAGRVDAESQGDPPSIIDHVESITYPDSGSGYIHAGEFDMDGDHIFLVNRRAYDTSPQQIRVWLSEPGWYWIVDRYTDDSLFAFTVPDSGTMFTTSLEPGEGKLFRISKLDTAYVSGHSADYPPYWSGNLRLTADFTVDSSDAVMILPAASIYIEPDSNVTFDVEGDLIAEGTAAQPIKFMSADTAGSAGDWYGIRHLGSGKLSMQHTEVGHAYKGIWINNTSDSIDVEIANCSFSDMTYSGISIDADPRSMISISNSEFQDWGYYGIQIHEGFATVAGNTFEGMGLTGIRVDGAYHNWVVGGSITNNTFAGMQQTQATGVHLYGIRDDGLPFDPDSSIVAQNYFYGFAHAANQCAIQVSNCLDSITLVRNGFDVVEGYDTLGGFGIINFSTKTLVKGSTEDAGDPNGRSRIVGYANAVYCFSSSQSDPNYAKVRSILFDTTNLCNVYVHSNSKVDLGSAADSGLNAFYVRCPDSGFCCSSLDDSAYHTLNVDNRNTSFTVPAQHNFWANRYCPGKGPNPNDCWAFNRGDVDSSNYLPFDPFEEIQLPKLPGIQAPSLTTDALPQSYSLWSYPNPFNSRNVIEFAIVDAGNVDLTVYNILGQRIRSLWSGNRDPGVYRIEWDGRDAHGTPLASGVYIYRIQTPVWSESKSVVLLK